MKNLYEEEKKYFTKKITFKRVSGSDKGKINEKSKNNEINL